MLRRAALIVLVGALSCALPAPALARKRPVQPTDPSANSPAGVVYAIPLDSARQDAAPHSSPTHKASPQASVSGASSNGGPGGSASAGAGDTSSGSGSAGGGSALSSASAGPSSAHHATTHTRSRASSGARDAKATSNRSRRTAPILVPGGQPGSLIHSSNGYGSSSKIPGVNVAASAGLGAVDGNGTAAPVTALVLAAAVLLVGGFVGFRARR